jgi:hypothetical protein
MMDIDDMGGVAALAVVGGLVLFSGGGIGQLTGGGAGANLKADRSAMVVQNVASQAKAEFLGGRQEIAEQRYQSCLVHYQVSAVQKPEHVARGAQTIDYATVVEGDRPMNPVNGGTYSPGTVICDAWGNTAIIGSDGIATDAAFTGSDKAQSYVKAYFDRFNQNLGGQ